MRIKYYQLIGDEIKTLKPIPKDWSVIDQSACVTKPYGCLGL